MGPRLEALHSEASLIYPTSSPLRLPHYTLCFDKSNRVHTSLCCSLVFFSLKHLFVFSLLGKQFLILQVLAQATPNSCLPCLLIEHLLCARPSTSTGVKDGHSLCDHRPCSWVGNTAKKTLSVSSEFVLSFYMSTLAFAVYYRNNIIMCLSLSLNCQPLAGTSLTLLVFVTGRHSTVLQT